MAQIKTPKDWMLERKVQDLIRSAKSTKANQPVERRLDELEGWIANLADLLKMLIVPRVA